MGLDKIRSGLDLYWDFWDQAPVPKDRFVFNGQGERLCDNTAAGQEMELKRLKEIADHRGIEGGWMDYVEHDATYEENKENLLNAKIPLDNRGGGMNPLRSPFEKDREKARRKEEYLEQEYQQEKREALSQESAPEKTAHTQYDQPSDDLDAKQTIEGLGADPSDEVKKSDDSGDNDLVTSRESEYLEDTPKGAHGHATFSAPKPLIALLDRIKDERELDSRRAAIEDMVASEELAPYFKDDSGDYWPEWVAAIEASKHLEPDIED